ncbi:MAG: beta-galactosidase [Clostridia bacterium]|nr:beta-galactosidase [Clostridia bacterium]
MKQRILSVCIVLCVLLGTVQPVFAGRFSDVVSQTPVNQGNLTLNPVEISGDKLVLSGTHTSGKAGKHLSWQIVDGMGRVYGIGEMRTASDGKFSVTSGVLPSAYGKLLTAQVRSLENDAISSAPFTCVYEVDAGDFIAAGQVTLTDTIWIDSITYMNPAVVIQGAYAGNAGKTIKLTVVDAVDESVVYLSDLTARTTAGGGYIFTLNLPSSAWDKRVKAVITCTAEANGAAATVEFAFAGGYQANREKMVAYVSEIESLIATCEAQGLSVEYEKANYHIVNRFLGFLDEFLSAGQMAEYEYNYAAMLKLVGETIEALNGYLDGTLLEKVAPMYVASDITVRGQSLVATTNVKGERKEQPIFLNGYGHWADSLGDYPYLPDYGANYAHYEVGVSSILKGIDESGNYIINEENLARVKEVFRRAEENNLALTLATITHYFPKFIYEKYPEISNGYHPDDEDFPYPDFMPFNPTHPEVLRAIKAYLDALIPAVKEYKSLSDIMIANEPFFISSEYPDYYLKDYQAFLEEKYGNVISLYRAYGKWFNSFEDVTMPTGQGMNARYMDWREFNDSILTQWFTELTDMVHELDATIPVHAKCSAYIASHNTGRRRNFCGTNYEQWSQVFDINGCDAWAIYGEAANTLQGKTMWYDFQTSLKNAPIINSEDHILRDSVNEENTVVYRDMEYRMNVADMWQGAIHGRAGSVYWLWDKSARTGEGSIYYNSNLTRRVDHVAAIGKVNLDLNRLANEVTAIQQKPARVAVMYSNYTQVGVEYHVAAMYEAYKYLQNNGEKVFIANDTYPEKINENENLELLIVPVGAYMPQKVWEEIQKFQNKGKQVIFAELDTAYYTEIGGSIGSTLKNAVLNNATRVEFGRWDSVNMEMSGCDAVYGTIREAIQGFRQDVQVTTGNGAVEWTAAEYGDGYVVNLCNHAEESAEVTISSEYEIIGDLFDLTENKAIGETFTLAPFETKLIKITTVNSKTEFFYSDGTKADKVQNDTITVKLTAKADAGNDYVHLVALYSGDQYMYCVVSGKGKADKNGIIRSEVPISVQVGEHPETCQIKSYVFDSLTSLIPYIPAAELVK